MIDDQPRLFSVLFALFHVRAHSWRVSDSCTICLIFSITVYQFSVQGLLVVKEDMWLYNTHPLLFAAIGPGRW